MSVNNGVTGGVRLIKMLVELHRRGYQRLRIFPYKRTAWRLEFGPSSFFSTRNGAYMPSHEILNTDGTREDATYSGASEFQYFGWTDVEQYDSERLAGVFISRFPGICAASEGRDWEYAGWLSELSGNVSRTRQLPYVMEEYFEPGPEELTYIPLCDYENGKDDLKFPLPPSVVSGEQGLVRERDELRARVEELRVKVATAINVLK